MDEPRNPHFAHVATRGLFWAFVSTGAGKLIALVGVAVLARLLSPAEFGLLGLGLLWVTYVETLCDLGAGSALIAFPDRRADAAQIAFRVHLAGGVVWLLTTWFAAPTVASFFHNPDAIPVLRLLAWSFPLRALGGTHDALLRKDLHFRSRSVPELAMALIRVTVSVGLALAGLGVWSLVWGQLAGIAAWSLLLWRVTDWRPRRTTPRELVKPILSYGRGIVAVNLLAAVVHHADLLVVGRAFGATVLGLYQMAQKLPEATIILVIWTTGKVLFPAFAAVQKEPEVLRSAYLMALRYVSLLALPSALVFLFLAEPIVLLVFGESWHGAAPLLRAVGIACAFRALGSHAGDVLKATGRSSLLARLGVVKALILIPLLVVASGVSALAVAVALAAVTATSAAVNTAVVCRLNQLTMRDVATALRPSLQASAIFAAALLAIEALGLSSGGPLALAAGITASIGCYLLALGVASPDIYARAWQSFAGSPTLRRRVEVER